MPLDDAPGCALFLANETLRCRRETDPPPSARKQKFQPALHSEWEERGDSPVLGALFLVGILRQEGSFKLHDIGAATLRASQYERASGKEVLLKSPAKP